MSDEGRFEHNRRLAVAPLGEAVVLTDAQANIVHHLNEVATIIWRRAEGRSRAELHEIARSDDQGGSGSDDQGDEVLRQLSTVQIDQTLDQLVEIGALLP